MAFEKAMAAQLIAPIKTSAGRFPGLAVVVFESEEDHVLDDVTYPKATVEINTFLDAGIRWIRLNPDLNYLEWAIGKKSSKAIQNPAGRRFDARTVRDAVEPEDRDGGPTDKTGMIAAVAELADRTWRHNWAPILGGVLTQAAQPKLTERK
jgi:hypothetical protein